MVVQAFFRITFSSQHSRRHTEKLEREIEEREREIEIGREREREREVFFSKRSPSSLFMAFMCCLFTHPLLTHPPNPLRRPWQT